MLSKVNLMLQNKYSTLQQQLNLTATYLLTSCSSTTQAEIHSDILPIYCTVNISECRITEQRNF